MGGSKSKLQRRDDGITYSRTMEMIPPQSITTEEAVLGALMLEMQNNEEVMAMLKPELFYKTAHQIIMTAITNVYDRGSAVDIITVTQELEQMGQLEDIGGPYYIVQLTSKVATSANIQSHILIIFEKYLLRELINMSEETLKYAFAQSIFPLDLVSQIQERLDDIAVSVEILKEESTVSAVDSAKEQFNKTHVENISNYYATGFTGIDNVIGICRNEILLFGGPAGAGKTRFLIAIMDKLVTYPDVSIHWFNFEDSKEKIIRCFAAIHLLISEELLREKKKKLPKEDAERYLAYLEQFKQYDIVFVEEPKYIKQVGSLFTAFCKKRPGRMNICIIDNIMLLEDNTADRDDIIGKELSKIRIRTKGLILPVHHYNDEQQEKGQLRLGYRPRLVHLKGRESYRRVCTQILLINKPGNYADLVAEYKGLEEIMKYMYIIDVAKNRDGVANEDSSTLIRMWANLDFLHFKDIEDASNELSL